MVLFGRYPAEMIWRSRERKLADFIQSQLRHLQSPIRDIYQFSNRRKSQIYNLKSRASQPTIL
jgi:hypothetical protein